MAGQDYEKVAARDADDDTHSILSGSQSGSDDDDGYTGRPSRRPRTSEDRRRYDLDTLAQEEEAEKLLVGGDGRRNKRWKGEREMLQMEQGGESERSSIVSSEEDSRRLGEAQSRGGKKSWAKRYRRLVVVYGIIVGAFLGLLYGAYKATGRGREETTMEYHPEVLSNGTHTFAPTTILISLDGFRADFLHRGLTPNLNAFLRAGVSPKYMMPSFPSVTFPNHFTLVTGLYPESHGLVGNTFWDPHTEKEFYYTDPARSMTPEWWNAEPVWETAELAGVRTAIHMWPGSEAHIGSVEPMYVDTFNSKEDLGRKTERILGWLDLPGHLDETAEETNDTRPQLIAAYVPNVDADGHKYGPNSTETRATIAKVDTMLGALFAGLETRNLSSIANVIIVSDHGMATTSTTRLVQLEDLLDPSLIAHTDGWPLYGLRPHDASEAHLVELYNDLYAKSQSLKYKGSFQVYLRDKNMPARYHFSSNPRIAPLWIVPTTGWAIVTSSELNVTTALAENATYHPRGIHGYDHEHPLMRAIFAARGPAFPHEAGSEVEVFQNTQVYNVVCDSLGLEPVANNGTLRLPFKPTGVHEIPGPGEVVEDPLPDGGVVPTVVPVPIVESMPPVESAATSGSGTSVVWTTDAQGSLVTASPNAGSADGDKVGAERPEIHDHEGDENLNHEGNWWQWAKDKWGKAKGWAVDAWHRVGGEGKDGEKGGKNETDGT